MLSMKEQFETQIVSNGYNILFTYMHLHSSNWKYWWRLGESIKESTLIVRNT